MATITGITESGRRDGRFELVVDGKVHATVSLDIIDRFGLRVGGTLTEPLATAVEAEAAALQTYDRALNMLALQARSTSDLRRRLVQKGEDPAHVDAALARLTSAGFLDDAEYARQFARSKVLGAGMAKRRLQAELARRGVARQHADLAISEVLADEAVDQGAIVEEAARKKLKTLGKVDPPTRRRRLYAYLARRGYDADEIRRAMEVVLERGETFDELDE
jgi:regulatory protein